MTTIRNIIQKYKDRLDILDTELIIANSLAKPREFVLTHPEYEIPNDKSSTIDNLIKRRMQGEPLSYITGQREFFGLDFFVNKHTLIPRPETEMIVEDALSLLRGIFPKEKSTIGIIDIGTGSGAIIISIAKAMESLKNETLPTGKLTSNLKFVGIDINEEALKTARKNSAKHLVDDKIKFLSGNLLAPLVEKMENGKWKHEFENADLIITANLPYLSEKIYESAPRDVKDFEPKTALLSNNQGLAHYEEMFQQLKNSAMDQALSSLSILIEYSPEQKILLRDLIKKILPKAKTEFKKDLAGKWRTAKITLAKVREK